MSKASRRRGKKLAQNPTLKRVKALRAEIEEALRDLEGEDLKAKGTGIAEQMLAVERELDGLTGIEQMAVSAELVGIRDALLASLFVTKESS